MPTRDDFDADGYGTDIDCDDHNFAAHPGATDLRCNGIDEDCDGTDACPPDADGDGARADVDCDDADPARSPYFAELACNGIDDSCSGADYCPPEDPDPDRDGWGSDCAPMDPAIHPGASEVFCDGVDQDCVAGDCCTNDDDRDGFSCREDCDDEEASVYPGRPLEAGACYNADVNCNGLDDEEPCL